jgi:hypothetical protein
MTNYIGRDLDKISNIEILDNITFDGSQSYTLQKGGVNFTPNSAQSIILGIDGITQIGNFSVNGSTIDFGVAVANTSTCNYIIHLGTGLLTAPSDGSVTNVKLGTAPTLEAKGSGGTAGGVKYFCEAGTHGVTIRSPAHANYSGSYELKLPTAQGSANTFLKNDGSGNLSFGAVSSDFVKLGSGTISSTVSTFSIDGYFTSDYDNYVIIVNDVTVNTSSGNELVMRFNSGGSPITGSSYTHAFRYIGNQFGGGANNGNINGDNNSSLQLTNDVSSNANSSSHLKIIIHDPLKTDTYKLTSFDNNTIFQNAGGILRQVGIASYRGSTGAISGATFMVNSGGSYTSASWKIYGIK